jgi:hypothetical protein
MVRCVVGLDSNSSGSSQPKAFWSFSPSLPAFLRNGLLACWLANRDIYFSQNDEEVSLLSLKSTRVFTLNSVEWWLDI